MFNAPAMVERLQAVLASWYGAPVPLLAATSLDTAVANGAARAVLARHGLGEQIGGGTARAYYIGVEGRGAAPAALCVAPRAMSDGASVEIPDRVFDLVLNQLVEFPLYAYTGDRVDPPGALAAVDEELDPLAPLQTVLRDPEHRGAGRDSLPVTIKTTLTDAGALEVHLVTLTLPPRRFLLDFALDSAAGRPAETSPQTEAPASGPSPGLGKARAALERGLGTPDPKAAKGLRRKLESVLGPRGDWSAATCRTLADALLAREGDRARGQEHELAWLRLCGWCLRPGFGAPGDDARIDALWGLRERGPASPSKLVWVEWWILWRRVAAGVSAARQRALYDDVRPWLWRAGPPPPGPPVHGPVEMMQLLAALERLSVEVKTAAGELFLERARKLGSYWPLGRAGARALLRAEPSLVVPPQIAERWLQHVLGLDWDKADGAAFAAASIARLTGDPARDIDSGLRAQVADRLAKAKAPATWIDMVVRPSDLAEGDLRRVLGDALPAGLRLGGG